MFWFATKLRKSMVIGNGIDRRKPLNAHVNLHRLVFYILHTLGEIYTTRKSFTSLVGTVGQLSLSTMNVFTTFVKQKGEKWYGKISKWRFFYPLFLLQIWRCVYPCSCPSWKPEYLIAWLSLCFILERSWVALSSDVCEASVTPDQISTFSNIYRHTSPLLTQYNI